MAKSKRTPPAVAVAPAARPRLSLAARALRAIGTGLSVGLGIALGNPNWGQPGWLPAQGSNAPGNTAGEVFSDPTVTNTRGFLAGAVPYGYPPMRGSRELLRTATRNPWIFAVTTKISTAMAAVHWRTLAAYDEQGNPSPTKARAYRSARRQMMSQCSGARDHHRCQKRLKKLRAKMGIEEVVNYPLTELLEHPNPTMTGYDLMEFTQRQIELVGEAFWIIERNEFTGLPSRLWPAPNYWVIRTPSPLYPYFDVFYNGLRTQVPEHDMVWMKRFDPENPYARGTWAGFALGDEIDTDQLAGKVAKQVFENNSTPAGIISMEADSDSMEEAREDWEENNRGVLSAFRVAWLNAKAKFIQLTPNFADQGILELRKAKRDDFRGIYSVPPELVGITETSNRSTIEAAQTIFAVNALVPRLEWWQAFYAHRLVPEYDKFAQGVIFEYESPVPEDREFNLTVMLGCKQAFSLNTWREAADQPPIDGFDDIFPLPSTVAPFATDIDDITAGPPEPPTPEPAVDPDAEPAPAKKPKKKPTKKDYEAALATVLEFCRKDLPVKNGTTASHQVAA
jgi:HK97 family phage portal protein